MQQELSIKQIKKTYNISTWDNLKLNYWGITKAGNTSVKLVLHNKNHINKKSDGINKWVHSVNYTKYITPNNALSNNFTNFSVTRNPYRRFESMYNDMQRRKYSNRLYKCSVYEFLEYLENTKDENRNVHVKSQSWFIGKYYNKITTFDITDHISIEQFLKTKIKHVNTGNNIQMFDNSVYNRVYKIYQEDFELLGYSK